jgi:hypothetical protein
VENRDKSSYGVVIGSDRIRPLAVEYLGILWKKLKPGKSTGSKKAVL